MDELIGTKREREVVESERPTEGLNSVTLPFIVAPMISEAGSIDNPAPALAFFAARILDESIILSNFILLAYTSDAGRRAVSWHGQGEVYSRVCFETVS